MLAAVDHRSARVEAGAESRDAVPVIAGVGPQSPSTPQAAQDPLTTPGHGKRGDLCRAGQGATCCSFSGSSAGQSWQTAAQALASVDETRRKGKDKQANRRDLGLRLPNKENQSCHCSTTSQGTHNVFFFGRRQEGPAPGKTATSLFQGSKSSILTAVVAEAGDGASR